MTDQIKSFFEKGQHWLAALSLKKKTLLCLILGGLLALTQAPFMVRAFLWVSFPLFFLLITGRSLKGKMILTFSFAMGYFVPVLYWIAFAFHVDMAKFWWMIPFSVLGLPAILTLFVMAAMAVYHGVVTQLFKGRESYLLFAVCWMLAEWCRGHWFTGFPWGLVGYAWVTPLEISQIASFGGIYFLSLLTVLVAGLPLAYRTLRPMVYVGQGALAVVIIGLWGWYRLLTPTTYVSEVELRLVQPCITQSLKWDPKMRREIFEEMMRLSRLPSGREVTHILWPEAALPFFAEEIPVVMSRLSSLVEHDRGAVILGVPRQKVEGPEHLVWNGMIAVGKDAHVLATYNKHHLVPFGEYVPLRFLLPGFVQKVTAGALDYSPGSGPKTVSLMGLPPFSPLICYEVIFPGALTPKKHRPQWLLNLTNDGWYGRTSGPYQHFEMSRMRAIEEGLPLVRVANNGISAVIDAYGRIVARLNLDEKGVLDTRLPAELGHPTLYSLWRDRIFWLVMLFLTGLSFVSSRYRHLFAF